MEPQCAICDVFLLAADTNLLCNTQDVIVGDRAILEDPLLTTDHDLLAGSPAVDAGIDIPRLATNLEANSRPPGAGFDPGAFERALRRPFLPAVLHE